MNTETARLMTALEASGVRVSDADASGTLAVTFDAGCGYCLQRGTHGLGERHHLLVAVHQIPGTSLGFAECACRWRGAVEQAADARETFAWHAAETQAW